MYCAAWPPSPSRRAASPRRAAVFCLERRMKKLLLYALLLLVGWKLSLKFLNAAPPPPPTEPDEPAAISRSAPAVPSRAAELPAAPEPLAPPAATPPAAPPAWRSESPSQNFRCDGRTHCSQMTSCAEATYFLKNCPNTKMDGNGDGVPCERQWCG